MRHTSWSKAACNNGSRKMEQFSLTSFEEVAAIIPQLAEAFPDPARTQMGISELLTNGIEHGNLGIGYAQKGALLRSGQWIEEIERRSRLPEHRGKRLRGSLFENDDMVGLHLRDDGSGFDWKRYLEIDASRITDLNGRGIAMARHVAFDLLHYNTRGNEVWAYCWR